METYETPISGSCYVEFKSYYVVWKLEDVQELISDSEKFKSYYVVWKLSRDIKRGRTQQRLNRTMQYGNLFSAPGKSLEAIV